MVGRRGLGKGIDSMIPDKGDKSGRAIKPDRNVEDVSRETLIDINEIEPNQMQPRKNFDEDSLQELAESIKQVGIIQPLVLQKRDKFYEIVAGERRWRAARIAGMKKIPAVVKEYSDEEIIEIAIIENIQREDLNPIEEAHAYQRLIEEFHLKQDEVADRVCKSRTAITNSIRLLKLSDKVQQLLVDDIISGGHGRALLPIEDMDLQYNLAMKILDEKLSVRDTERMVKNILNSNRKEEHQEKEKNNVNDVIYRDLEEKMKRVVGTKVNIHKKKNNKGTIEIEYYSEDELDRLVDLITAIET